MYEKKAMVINILKQEDIRLMDGRFRDGFVDLNVLNKLIEEGKAEIYDNQGIKFVRLTP